MSADGGRFRSIRGAYEQTPPPSPADAGSIPKVDTEGITDDVVVAVIEQLEKTGNRPHLLRELAVVLSSVNETVANSANPSALLSARLCAYTKRQWTALSPCPLTKELISIRSRKALFYYLTTCPHQPFPDNLDEVIMYAKQMMATPSVSSASVDQDEDDAMNRDRARLSPSPEVDLSPLEFEDHNLGDGSGTSSSGVSESFHAHRNSHRLLHNNRAVSPPLEGDEREFTQTASSVRERASEEKANRQEGCTNAVAVSFDGDNHFDDEAMGFSEPPMDDPLSVIGESQAEDDHQYLDYFSHEGSCDREQVLDETAVPLFEASPSPSLSSVSSSVSSGTGVMLAAGPVSEGYLTGIETISGALKLRQSINDKVSILEASAAASVTALKRTIDPIEMEVSPDFSPYQTQKQQAAATLDFEMIIDSWSDLRSPETVEVDELDEMFGDI